MGRYIMWMLLVKYVGAVGDWVGKVGGCRVGG